MRVFVIKHQTPILNILLNPCQESPDHYSAQYHHMRFKYCWLKFVCA